MLLDGDKIRNAKDQKKIYFSDPQMKLNNFWKSR